MQKILLVEDNDVTGKLISGILEEKGFRVKTLGEGASVVQVAKEFGPDLVLMDIVLPDMDGAEAVGLLQDNPKTTDIPVLFLSAILEKDAPNHTINVNEITYPALSKSITTSELLNAINKAIIK